MQRILKLNMVIMCVILCALFLFCGVVEINDETTFITTGETENVIKVQSISGKKLITEEKKNGDINNIASFNEEKLSGFLTYAKYCTVPPLGNILWAYEEIKN